jgi:nucleotide-binding universal stress UspA family protein
MTRLLNRLPHQHSREATSTTSPPARTVVVATDGTTSSRAAVEKGLSMAQELGARVTFVSAYRPPWAALGKPFYERSLRKRLAVPREALDKAKAAADAFGVDAYYEIVEGKPANAIARLAAARDADLVVVGSRGLPSPAAALCGSVSRSLVGQSDRAVLVAGSASASRRPSGLSAIAGQA